jgi:hypothetical protein
MPMLATSARDRCAHRVDRDPPLWPGLPQAGHETVIAAARDLSQQVVAE